jgi:hypothetical protein
MVLVLNILDVSLFSELNAILPLRKGGRKRNLRALEVTVEAQGGNRHSPKPSVLWLKFAKNHQKMAQ